MVLKGLFLFVASGLVFLTTPVMASQANDDPYNLNEGRREPLPKDLEGVEIVEHLDQRLPLELEFVDGHGKSVKLGNFFSGGKPVILTMVYYTCPQLCTQVLNGLLEAVKTLDWTPGDEYEIVTVSFDPTNKPAQARVKQQNYIRELGRPEAQHGWHFLTGSKANIASLSEATGFNYRWVEDQGEYAHGSCIMICTPDGRLSRYLYGIRYDADTVELSLAEAAEGEIGSSIDRLLKGMVLYCFRYDASKGRYTLAAVQTMRLGGLMTLFLLGTTLLVLWRRESRRRKSEPETAMTGESR